MANFEIVMAPLFSRFKLHLQLEKKNTTGKNQPLVKSFSVCGINCAC